mgnify:FL=1
MKLQTIVDIMPSAWKIGYEDKILMLGSCFADEIAAQMEQRYLAVTRNPFGTLYNPLSIAQALQMTAVPTLIEHDGLWHSMAHHGAFSRSTKEEAEKAVRSSIETMQGAFEEANVVIVTFGTAWVYEWSVGSGQQSVFSGQQSVVGNCHKMPAECFTRRRLTAEEIIAAWQPIIERYADKHWIFTVSPIRHVKDGLHENQLSKATLLQAVDVISNQYAAVSYFPSYEIMLDELRDYRFYADDLVHPSSLAVQYIWERFIDCFCTSQTRNEMNIQHKRWKQTQHRPLH